MVLGVTQIQEGLGDAGEEGGTKSTFLGRREVYRARAEGLNFACSGTFCLLSGAQRAGHRLR